MAIQLCPVDTANVHPRNILGSSSSFDRERLSPFGSLSSRCWETVVYITLSSGPAQPGGQPCQKGDAFQHSQNSARRSITPLCQNRGPAKDERKTPRMRPRVSSQQRRRQQPQHAAPGAGRLRSSLFPDCTPVVCPLTASACRLMGQRSFSSLVELDRSRPLGPALARSSPDTVKSRTPCG